jgi:hypothetical protein
MVGGKGGGKLGKLGKLAKFATKNSKMLKIGGGVLAGGIAAYEGYSDYKDADEQVKSGAITEDQGDIKKTGAVGGAAGGLGGALGGAALGTMILPGVGTVIGGAIGGLAGSKVGKGIGEWGSKTWKGLTGKGGDKTISSSGETMSYKEKDNYSMRYDPTTGKYSVNGKEVSEKDYEKIQNSDGDQHIKAIKTAINNADQVAAQSSDNAIAKTPSNAATSNNIVNAPTTISKQTQNTAVNVPIRDHDHSIRKYYNSRFAS